MKLTKFITNLIIGLALLLGASQADALGFSDYAENKLADHLFRNTAYSESTPASFYIALYTTACTDAAAGTEVATGGYARVAITRSTSAWTGTHGTTTGASSGTNATVSNAAAVIFPAASGDWGTVTHWGVVDASTAGNLIVCAALTASRNITNGSTPSFGAGALTIQIDSN
jgi:hypothetical protein